MALSGVFKLVHQSGGGGFARDEKGVFLKILSTAALSPAQVAANTSAEEEFDLAGVSVGDIVLWVEKPTHQAGLATLGGRVDNADKVTIKFGNYTGAGITPTAAQVYKVAVLRINE